MRIRESRWRRRRRAYYHVLTALGLFGFFLILSGITPDSWALVFAVLGYVSLVFGIRNGLALWHLDRLVFDRKAFASTTRRQTAGISPGIVRQGSAARSDRPHPAF